MRLPARWMRARGLNVCQSRTSVNARVCACPSSDARARLTRMLFPDDHLGENLNECWHWESCHAAMNINSPPSLAFSLLRSLCPPPPLLFFPRTLPPSLSLFHIGLPTNYPAFSKISKIVYIFCCRNDVRIERRSWRCVDSIPRGGCLALNALFSSWSYLTSSQQHKARGHHRASARSDQAARPQYKVTSLPSHTSPSLDNDDSVLLLENCSVGT